MITYKEWEFLVEMYNTQFPHSVYRNKFGVGHRITEKMQLEMEQKHGISIGAFCALGNYSGRGCFKINQQLRADECDEAIYVYHDFLIRALDELPSYNLERCLRWSNIDEKGFEFVKKHIGKRMLMPQFWSTSKHNKGKAPMIFDISTNKNSNSRYIKNVVERDNEEEVLFKAHTVFRIDGTDGDTIYLTEMENYSDYELFLCDYFWKSNSCFQRSKMYEAYLRK